MDKKELETQRLRLLYNLAKIGGLASKIQQEMSSVPHSRGVAHRALVPRNNGYIVSSKNGFTAEYIDLKGKRYEVEFRMRD